MKKIKSVFQRNYETDRLIRNEVAPGCEWVLAGEGVPTRKYDGTCCLVEDSQLFKRYDAKHGKTPPPGFRPAQEPDQCERCQCTNVCAIKEEYKRAIETVKNIKLIPGLKLKAECSSYWPNLYLRW